MKNLAIVPKDGYILAVRFKQPNMEEFDTVFCEYCALQNGLLNLMDCRSKRFSFDSQTSISQAYSSKLGTLSLGKDYVVQIYQFPQPDWFYRAEEDVLPLIENERSDNPCSQCVGGVLQDFLGLGR